jgi:hypothetical protein
MSNLFDNYSVLFTDDIDEVQRRSVNAYRTEAMLKVAAQDAAWIEEQVEKLAAFILDADMREDVYAVLDNAAFLNGGDIEKVAKKGVFSMENIGKASQGVTALSAAAGLASLIGSAVKSRNEKKRARQAQSASYNTVMEANPHLRNDPSSAQYFNTVRNFAPSVAADPVLLGNVLNDMQTMGPAAMTVERVKGMVDVHRHSQPGAPAKLPLGSQAAAHLSDLSKAVGGYAKRNQGMGGETSTNSANPA